MAKYKKTTWQHCSTVIPKYLCASLKISNYTDFSVLLSNLRYSVAPSKFLVVDILICFLTTFLWEQGEEEEGVEASPSEPPTEPRRVARPGEPCNVQTEALEGRKKPKIRENPRAHIQIIYVGCEQITWIIREIVSWNYQKNDHTTSCESQFLGGRSRMYWKKLYNIATMAIALATLYL